MGYYVTITTIQTKMPGVQFDSVTTALVNDNLDNAEYEIQKYLSRRYDVSGWTSTTNTPPTVQLIAKQLTLGYTYMDMSRGDSKNMNRAEKYIKYAVDNLIEYRDYRADLLDSSGSKISELTNNAKRVLSNTKDYSNTFNEDSYLNWQVSPSKLDDIDDERDGDV